jgi:hypothetical protein
MTPGMIAQLTSGVVVPARFAELQFESDTVYVWSGYGKITPPGPPTDPTSTFPYGETFIGLGWFGGVASVPQTSEGVAQNITLTLSGIPTELLTDAIDQVRETGIATLWLGFLLADGANNNLVGDPLQDFQGALDVPTITEGAATSSVSITAENPLVDLNRPSNRRFTDVDQQLIYPGDLGFQGVGSLQGQYLGWPMYLSLP